MSPFRVLLHIKIYERPGKFPEAKPNSTTSILLLIQTHAQSVFVYATPGRSSGIRHRNQLTAKAWEKAVQELGKAALTSQAGARVKFKSSQICLIVACMGAGSEAWNLVSLIAPENKFD